MSTPDQRPMGGMDLATVGQAASREDEGQVVHLRDAQGEPAFDAAGQPVTVRIAGQYSKLYRRTQAEQAQRLLRQRGQRLTEEQLTRNRVELVAVCILEWQGITNQGQPLPLTKDNASKLLALAPWVREQLEEVQGDHASFFGTSSST